MIPAEKELDALLALQKRLSDEMVKRERARPTSFFPWHPIQDWVLNAAFDEAEQDVRVMLACGGNRGGKSALGKGIFSDVIRRTSPLATKLRMTDRLTGQVRHKTDMDAITVWIVPPTLEKARADWVSPSDGFSVRYWLGDLFIHEQKSPDHIFYSRPPGMSKEQGDAVWSKGLLELLDKTILKSHDQDLLSFEASAVDLIVVDEEIMDRKKWNSMMMRVGTPNGTIVMCYTPLHGLSWSYDQYWRPLIKQGQARQIADRCWIHDQGDGSCVVAVQFGAADNPLAKDYAREIRNDPGMSDAEKSARLDGEYGFVEGALVPALAGLDVISPEADHEVYVVDYLPGDTLRSKDAERYGVEVVPGKITDWYLVVDPNKSYGGLLAAHDAEGNTFLVWEHLEAEWPDRKHAESFKKIEKKWVRPGQDLHRIADPGSAGAHSIVNMADLGLMFTAAVKGAGSVATSVKQVRSMAFRDPAHHHPVTGRPGAPRIYFYRPGVVSRWLDGEGRLNVECRIASQISLARQTDNPNAAPDTPHKSVRSKLDLFDCLRYLAVTLRPVSPDEEGGTKTRVDDDTYHARSLSPPIDHGHIGSLDDNFYMPDWFLEAPGGVS